MSEYITNGEEESQLQNNEYLQLKTVQVKKMDWKNIVRINTDGGYYRSGSLIIYLSDGDDFDFISVPYLGFLSDGPDRTLYVLAYKGKYYLLLEAIRPKAYQNVLKYPYFEEHSFFYICDYLYELDNGQLKNSSILVNEYETDLEHLMDMRVSVHESCGCIGNTCNTDGYLVYRKWTDEGALIHLGGMKEEDKQEKLNQKLKEAVYRILSQLREEGKNVCQYADDYVLASAEEQITIVYVLYTEEKGEISSQSWYFTVELEEEMVYVCAEGK